MPLKVSGAFHSPLMESAVTGFTAALAGVSFAEPRFPVIANASARPVASAAEGVRLLAQQLTAPVRWVECMQAAMDFVPDASFIELGPGAVLAGLLKRILPDARCLSIGTAADVEKFLA